MTMKKIFIAGFLGGFIAFAWSAVVHMGPTGHLGLSELGKNEGPVLNALMSNQTHEGLYFFPGMDVTKEMSKAEEDAWTAKYKAGPRGLLLYHSGGAEVMEPKQLIVEFLSTVACAIIAALILSTTVGKLTCRATMVMMIGVFGWLAISVSQWNWYGFPLRFIAVDLIDQSIGWFLAGLLIAKMVKPANAAAAS
jgi:hypothetical protein